MKRRVAITGRSWFAPLNPVTELTSGSIVVVSFVATHEAIGPTIQTKQIRGMSREWCFQRLFLLRSINRRQTGWGSPSTSPRHMLPR